MSSFLLYATLSLLVVAGTAHADDWKEGRATFYGNEPCMDCPAGCSHDYIWPDQGTGWDVAALADTFPGYAGSCGSCYEVECNSRWIKDGYGASLQRDNVCKGGGSVVVKITDTCPCYYPNNYYSNKRWCCGDVPHFDMSAWAFEKIANLNWGVIAVRYRRVSCDTHATASTPSNPTPPVFPSLRQAYDRKDNLDWWKYFPNGGLTSPKDGQSYRIPLQDFLKKIGKA